MENLERSGAVVGYVDSYEVYYNGSLLDPADSLKLRNHSPTGFAWGYGGSGPAQLALAILLRYFNDEEMALAHYQEFKWRHIAKLDINSSFRITLDTIDIFAASCEGKGKYAV